MTPPHGAEPPPDLTQNLLFAGVPPESLAALREIPVVLAFASEEVIFDEDAVDDHLYIIVKGTVRISKRGRGGQQETLTYLEAGDYFGEMAAFDPAPRSARATAVGDVVLGRVGRGALEELLQVAPLPIVRNLSRRAIHRLREMDRHFIGEILETERLSLVGTMASSIIHDLKNPIGVIQGAAEFLSDDDDEARQRWVRMIQRTAAHMLEMVQELLDYTRGNTSLALSRVSVDEVMDELRERILHQAESSGIRVATRVEYRDAVRVDRGRFVRVLVNVVKNAVEAMPGGGALELAIDAANGDVRFSVADTGTGIPADLLPRIFEPFVSHGKASGTGLGMAIAKAVVEAHGGRITVESTPGQGTRFYIVIPRAPVPEPPSI